MISPSPRSSVPQKAGPLFTAKRTLITLEKRRSDIPKKIGFLRVFLPLFLKPAEKEEMFSLEDKLASIKRDKNSLAWQKLTEEISTRVADEKSNALAVELAEDYIGDIADKEEIPIEKFEPTIVKYMQKVDPQATMNPYKRAKAAYKMYKEDQKYNERLKKLEEKEKMFMDTSNSAPSRPQSKKEIIESALNSDDGLTRVLRDIQVGQETSRS